MPEVAIIGLRGGDDEESVAYLRQLGIRHVLRAPVRPSELFNALSSVLSVTDDHRSSAGISSSESPEQPPVHFSGHMLVSEDNRINQMYVVESLALFGCTCDIAVNGEEAIAAVRQKPYDLVLMDCHMPEMDGFTAAREIRRWEASEKPPKRLPIVALTANALKGDRERCLEAGMDDYLSKPIESHQLKVILEKYLERGPADLIPMESGANV